MNAQYYKILNVVWSQWRDDVLLYVKYNFSSDWIT